MKINPLLAGKIVGKKNLFCYPGNNFRRQFMLACSQVAFVTMRTCKLAPDGSWRHSDVCSSL